MDVLESRQQLQRHRACRESAKPPGTTDRDIIANFNLLLSIFPPKGQAAQLHNNTVLYCGEKRKPQRFCSMRLCFYTGMIHYANRHNTITKLSHYAPRLAAIKPRSNRANKGTWNEIRNAQAAACLHFRDRSGAEHDCTRDRRNHRAARSRHHPAHQACHHHRRREPHVRPSLRHLCAAQGHGAEHAEPGHHQCKWHAGPECLDRGAILGRGYNHLQRRPGRQAGIYHGRQQSVSAHHDRWRARIRQRLESASLRDAKSR
jgi:hypothetical protein